MRKNNKFNYQATYQNFLDLWSKDQYQDIKKNLNHFFQVSKKNTQTFFKHDLKHQSKNLQETYHAHKAMSLGASKHLPYSTLVLLGLRHSHLAYKQEIEKIIKDNVIKYKGTFYKLDDLEHQNKVRKALKNFQFEECSEIQDVA